jgi:hypothetical protein
MLRFSNEMSLTLRFESDFGESEWFAIGNFRLLTSTQRRFSGALLFICEIGRFSHTEWSGE